MAEPLKNYFSPEFLQSVAAAIKKQYRQFPEKKFLAEFSEGNWKRAELKTRVRIITLALCQTLPDDYDRAIEILVAASSGKSLGYFGVFYPDFVELYGMNHWDTSMYALSEFTKTSTSEFAIRPFIIRDEKRAMKQLLQWSKSKNHHVRRLSSEGCRPRLPWGLRLQSFVKNPMPIFPILENLKNDEELYVRKSVANNINDISKDHPELVLKLAEKWSGNSAHTDWIVKQALRTLLKSGNQTALKLFGHHDSAHFSVGQLMLGSKKIKKGDFLPFSFAVINKSQRAENCRIEYAIDYVKSNGLLSRKVFQVAKSELKPGSHVFKRKQAFKDLTTRKHYAGKHVVAILVNGEEKVKAEFELQF